MTKEHTQVKIGMDAALKYFAMAKSNEMLKEAMAADQTPKTTTLADGEAGAKEAGAKEEL